MLFVISNIYQFWSIYLKAGVIAHPGSYLDVETDNTMRSLKNISNVYLELKINWEFPRGEGLCRDSVNRQERVWGPKENGWGTGLLL